MSCEKPKFVKSRHISGITTRNPSQHCISIDSNIDSILADQPAGAKRRTRLKSDQTVEDSILAKHAKSQAKKALIRQRAKAKQLKVMKQAPHFKKHCKMQKKTQSEINLLVESMPNQIFHKMEKEIKKKKDTRRPQDVIDIPDVSVIKEALARVEYIAKPEVVDLKEMDILAKTQYFLIKKNEKLEQAEKEKIQKMLEECTFKPDLKKPEVKKQIHRKSMTALIGPKRAKVKPARSEQVEEIRVPAPVKKFKHASVDVKDKPKLLISESYSQFSPARKVYSFQEGADIKGLISRGHDMVSYAAYTTRKQ